MELSMRKNVLQKVVALALLVGSSSVFAQYDGHIVYEARRLGESLYYNKLCEKYKVNVEVLDQKKQFEQFIENDGDKNMFFAQVEQTIKNMQDRNIRDRNTRLKGASKEQTDDYFLRECKSQEARQNKEKMIEKSIEDTQKKQQEAESGLNSLSVLPSIK